MKSFFSSDKFFLVICIILSLSLGIGIFVMPMPTFSAEENRALAPAPRFSLSRLLSGELFEDVSDFYSDRLPLRSYMIRIKAMSELSLGKTENNGIIFSRNGRLTDRCIYDSYQALENNMEKLRGFCLDYGAICVIVPRGADIYTSSEECDSVIEKAGAQELRERLGSLGEDAYYKTDHHLDAEGSFALYEYVMELLGEQPLSRSQFTLTNVSEGFYGTVYSKCGLIKTAGDTVAAWRYDEDINVKVVCKDEGCGVCGLYCSEKLEIKDKYQYFLGGNHACLNVTLPSAREPRQHLYIIKDSFANSVIPLLARHFDLTVYDPRYCTVPISIQETDGNIVTICGIDTLATTGSFTKMLP